MRSGISHRAEQQHREYLTYSLQASTSHLLMTLQGIAVRLSEHSLNDSLYYKQETLWPGALTDGISGKAICWC